MQREKKVCFFIGKISIENPLELLFLCHDFLDTDSRLFGDRLAVIFLSVRSSRFLVSSLPTSNDHIGGIVAGATSAQEGAEESSNTINDTLRRLRLWLLFNEGRGRGLGGSSGSGGSSSSCRSGSGCGSCGLCGLGPML